MFHDVVKGGSPLSLTGAVLIQGSPFSKRCHFINLECLRLKRARCWGQVWILLLFLILPGLYKKVWCESLFGIPFECFPGLWNINQSSGLWFSFNMCKIIPVSASLEGLLHGRGALILQGLVPRRQFVSVLSPNAPGPATCGAGLSLMGGWNPQLQAIWQNGIWERWVAPYFGQNYQQEEREKAHILAAPAEMCMVKKMNLLLGCAEGCNGQDD